MPRRTPLERRLARLKQELGDEVQLGLSQSALEEVSYARHLRAHEGRRATYGALIWNKPVPALLEGVPALPSASAFINGTAPLDELRQFANGRASFIIRGEGVAPALAIDPVWDGSERTMSAFSTEYSVTVVQRLATGRVRLFVRDHIYTDDGGAWRQRPSARLLLGRIKSELTDDLHEIASGLLDLCVHTLSPSGIGATLVWNVTGAGVPPFVNTDGAIDAPQLSIASLAQAQAIAHALSQQDRAVLVRRDGLLTLMNVLLEQDPALPTNLFDGGTRHNSAGNFSASCPDELVFVVSSDGPITVFLGGGVLVSSEPHAA